MSVSIISATSKAAKVTKFLADNAKLNIWDLKAETEEAEAQFIVATDSDKKPVKACKAALAESFGGAEFTVFELTKREIAKADDEDEDETPVVARKVPEAVKPKVQPAAPPAPPKAYDYVAFAKELKKNHDPIVAFITYADHEQVAKLRSVDVKVVQKDARGASYSEGFELLLVPAMSKFSAAATGMPVKAAKTVAVAVSALFGRLFESADEDIDVDAVVSAINDVHATTEDETPADETDEDDDEEEEVKPTPRRAAAPAPVPATAGRRGRPAK